MVEEYCQSQALIQCGDVIPTEKGFTLSIERVSNGRCRSQHCTNHLLLLCRTLSLSTE